MNTQTTPPTTYIVNDDPSLYVIQPQPKKAPATPVKVTKKELTRCNGHYRASIGAERVNGKRKPKIWMLGKDIRVARIKEAHIRSLWDAIVNLYKAKGLPKTNAIWTQNWIALATVSGDGAVWMARDHAVKASEFNELADGGNIVTQPEMDIVIHATGPDSIDGQLTLSGAAKEFEQQLRADVIARNKGRARATRLRTSINAMLRFISHKPIFDLKHDWSKQSPLLSLPIEKIGYDEIFSLATNLKNRDSNGRAPDTIRTDLEGADTFFQFLEDSGKWKPTCNYSRLLKCQMSRLTTIAEQKKKRSGQDLFTVEELKTLYTKTVHEPRWRLYLLLGLNLCATQQQVSDLIVDDVDLDSPNPSISFIRGKTRHLNNGTGIEGRYPLWKETADRLKVWLKKHPPKGDYLLRTEKGFPLVRYDAGKDQDTKVDSVRQCWDKLLAASGAVRDDIGDFRWLSYKHLRKTAADAVAVLAGGGPAGEYYKELALAHAKDSVATRNYSGAGSADQDFEILGGYIGRLRSETFANIFESK